MLEIISLLFIVNAIIIPQGTKHLWGTYVKGLHTLMCLIAM